MNVPPEVLAKMKPDADTAYTVRIRHERKEDGSECTPRYKNSALVLSRFPDCWKAHCFRCGWSMTIPDNDMSPKDTCIKIKHSDAKREKMVDEISLPIDFIPITEQDYVMYNTEIPTEAVHWFMKYNVPRTAFKDYQFGYSHFYNRVIVPLKSNKLVQPHLLGGELQGWLGRECVCKNKQEREARKINKYLIRRKRSTEFLYFFARQPEPTSSCPVVLVEDVVSALRVAYAYNTNSIALCGTNISDEMMVRLKSQQILLWLDGDMFQKMFKLTRKFKALGFNITFVKTNKDPKCYNDVAIREIITQRLTGGNYTYKEEE